ncbi:MAG: lipopolysaccharide assembly protein LapA domain-containing protein [Stellaceae bacterium]
MKLLYWIVAVALAAAAALFAVSNRQSVSVGFWPLPARELPLYLVVLLALLAGFLLGEFVAWVNGGRTRRLSRERARRIAALERELAATQAMTTPAAAALAKATPPQVALIPADTGERSANR